MAARQVKLGKRAVLLQPRQGPAQKLIDVAMIIGKQNPRLEPLPVGAGIVDETAQRIIDAHCIEERKGPGLGVILLPGAVGDFIADRREHRGWKIMSELLGANTAEIELIALVEDIGVRNFLIADADRDRGAIVLGQIL